jgi:hypothetical protein
MAFGLVWKYLDAPVTAVASPVSFPGTITPPQAVQLRSSAIDTQTFESLSRVQFYLRGPDAAEVQRAWPYAGDPTRQSELDGGFEISFDGGNRWIRFNLQTGLQSDPSTWITLPAFAVGEQGQDGLLSPYDIAHLSLRYVIPPSGSINKVYDVVLAASFDIS